jgi:hypothetical protein
LLAKLGKEKVGEGHLLCRGSHGLGSCIENEVNDHEEPTFRRGVGLVYGISELATAEVYCGVSLSTVRLCVPNMCLISSKERNSHVCKAERSKEF